MEEQPKQQRHKTAAFSNNLMRDDIVHIEEKDGDIVNLVQQSVQQEDSQCREIKRGVAASRKPAS